MKTKKYNMDRDTVEVVKTAHAALVGVLAPLRDPNFQFDVPSLISVLEQVTGLLDESIVRCEK